MLDENTNTILFAMFAPSIILWVILYRKNKYRYCVGDSVEIKNKTNNEIRVISVVETCKKKICKITTKLIGYKEEYMSFVEGKDDWRILYVAKKGNIHEAKKMLKEIENNNNPNVTKYDIQKDIDNNDLVIYYHVYHDCFKIAIVTNKEIKEYTSVMTIDLGNNKDMEFIEADINMDEWEVMRKLD